jgi:hypothetical protein
MKNVLSVPILLFLLATTSSAETFEGPLVVKNGHPLYAAIGTPSLQTAQPGNALDLTFSYSSTHAVTENNDWYFGIDLEAAVTDIQFKRLVGANTELGIDIPIVRYGPGFMDNGLETVHKSFGIKERYGRSERPHNEFLFEVARNNKTIINGAPGKTAPGDIMAEVKTAFYKNEGAILSFQAFLNLPTGDPDSGFGSGDINGGVALLMNKELKSDLVLYVNAGIGLTNKLRAMEEVKLRNYYYCGAGWEWAHTDSILFNLQIIAQTSPFPKTGEKVVDYPSIMASFGGRYKIASRSSIGLAITEDPDSVGAPDIMMGVDYRYRF